MEERLRRNVVVTLRGFMDHDDAKAARDLIEAQAARIAELEELVAGWCALCGSVDGVTSLCGECHPGAEIERLRDIHDQRADVLAQQAARIAELEATLGRVAGAVIDLEVGQDTPEAVRGRCIATRRIRAALDGTGAVGEDGEHG